MPELDAGARAVVERLLAGIAAGPTAELAELYASDAVVELPFALPGGLRLIGRDAIATHFAAAGKAPMRLTPVRVRIHETTNPEIVVAEYDYEGEVITTAEKFTVSNVQIVRVCDGLIVGSRDFHDHSAIASALRPG